MPKYAAREGIAEQEALAKGNGAKSEEFVVRGHHVYIPRYLTSRRAVTRPIETMSPMHVFPDTNVLLHFPALDGLDWRSMCGTNEVIIHVTPPVLTELNKIKEIGYSKRIRKRAAVVQKRLKDLLALEGAACRIAEGVRVVFETETPNVANYTGLNPRVADDLLVAAALDYSIRSENEDIALATDDNGLGLVVKAKKWKLRLIEPSSEARLPEEPDEEDKERERLRRRIALLESAAPILSLTFENGQIALKLESGDSDLEAEVTTAVAEQRAKHPFLPDPKEPKRRERLTLRSVAAMNQDYASIMRNDPAEVNKYNNALKAYFREFEDAKRENLAIRRRLVKIQLQVENSGSAPARDVLAAMHFPDGFKVIDKRKPGKIFRKTPEPPLLSGYFPALFDPTRSFSSFLPPVINPEAPSLDIRKTNSYDVRWRVPKLRQDHVSVVDPIYILFDSAPFSFGIDYSIVADNLPETVSGQLHVVAPAASSNP